MNRPSDIVIKAPVSKKFEEILTPGALEFVAALGREFDDRRRELLDRRMKVQADIDRGKFPDFLEETRQIREGNWKAAPIPTDLLDRRVEITGPVDRKMAINALNSGASVYMADFEDSHSPTWEGTIQGQINVRDAVNGTISYVSPKGKEYRLGDKLAVLMVRPRGWHLVEKHMLVDGKPVSGSLFDFGLYLYHNAKNLIKKGTGPYFYLPKMESHLEARLWNDVFNRAQDLIGIPRGTIRATVLIETILAAFEMDEIIYELKDHIAGLNCGRWDYIFSFIKRFKNAPEYIFPDRAQITMVRHNMRSYAQLLIKTCHRRGIHAMGGMAAQIPIHDDEKANEEALMKVRDDKIREAADGHDGTWVAHPELVAIAKEEFDRCMLAQNQISRTRDNVGDLLDPSCMPAQNQLSRDRDDVEVTAKDLLDLPSGTITEAGLRINVSVAIQYMAAWLSGLGSVPINHLMEDAATTEISRTQLWQWTHHPKGILDDGRKIDIKLFCTVQKEELDKIKKMVGDDKFAAGNYEKASDILADIITSDTLEEFLTIRAYEFLD